MVKYYAQEKRVFDINKVRIHGTPIITNEGIASGFDIGGVVIDKTITNYNEIKISGNFIFHPRNVDGAIFKLSDNNTRLAVNASGNCYFIQGAGSNAVSVYTQSSLVDGDLVGFTVTKTASKMTISIIKNNSITYTNEVSNTNITLGNINNIFIGSLDYAFSYYTNSSIDLSSFKIYVDNKLVYSSTKPVYSLERRKEGFDQSKFTVVGSPTITEYGVASGFSGSNYLTSNNFIFETNGKNFIIEGKIKTGSNITNNANFFASQNRGVSLNINAGKLCLFLSSDNSTWNLANYKFGTYQLSPNTDYYIKFIYNGAKYVYSISEDGKNYIEDVVVESTDIIPNSTVESMFGCSFGNVVFTGSIDLPQFSITVDGKEVFTGAKEKFYAMRGM